MAQLINKPISKLSILFVISILVPGSILVYFSIQNIVSQKELTEKRLLEEQSELVADLAESFQHQLTVCATAFFSRLDSLSHPFPQKISLLDSRSCVAQVFIVNNNGEFIWPHFLQDTKAKQKHPKSREFLQAFAEAEKAEFAKFDLPEAAKLYRQALRMGKNKVEHAAATNALARVLTKRGLTKQALQHYRILVNRYGSVIDENGWPFAYYALHQITQFSSHNQSELILKDIETMLSRLLNGEIPLTEHTNLLLQEVSNWFAEQNNTMISPTHHISQKLNTIQKWLSFVLQEGNSVKQYFSARDGFLTAPKVGNFDAIVGNVENEPTLLLLHRKSRNSDIVGFKVDLAGLKDQVLAYAIKRNRSFDLQLNIVSKPKATQMARHPLTTIKELSPLVPLWRVWISPEDPKIIDRYVSNRRRLYGVALSLLIAGMALGVVLVLRDVSREQRLAQLRTDFVSNVSHELKTPLTSIRMLAETMRLGRIKKKSAMQEYLSMIVNESERLSRLINTVLDFSKIDQGKKRYVLEPTNLSEVVKSALSVMQNSIKEKGLKLKSSIARNVQTVADADAIEQALLNLLSNAIKYSRERREISVRLWTEGESIYIQVADRGLGIQEYDQKRVFEKFYRANIGIKGDTGGAGLGLTVVKDIVDAHDGKIKLESKFGEGTTFTIILPWRPKL
jgi:signal transduction histidine kinase/tetratricopeptide (TPR) repeat protein